MPTMDGYEMMVGDEVYHLINGKGMITEIKDAEIYIDFEGEEDCYSTEKSSTEISLGRDRQLYWSKPEFAPPAKTKNVAKYRWVVRTEEYGIMLAHQYLFATAKEVAAVYGVDESDCERIEMTKEIV